VKEKKTTEVFSMSFLDIMACGFGALVLILLISEFNEIEIIENKYTADLFLTKQDEVVTKTNQLNDVDRELTSKIKNLISIQDELDKVKSNLNNRANVVQSLSELSQLKQSQIIVKNEDQKEPIEQVVASGIRIDSRYLIFIIDNSGSMVEGAPWSRVVKEIETIIMTFPSLEGFMIMNDTGKTIVGGGNWVKPTKANRIDAVNKLKRVNAMTNSNPIPAIEKSINIYGRKYDDVGIFIIGDDIRESKNVDSRLLEINRINTKSDGSKYVRINALGFLTSRRLNVQGYAFEDDNNKYLTLMRELTEQNGGTLVVID
tara:strand:- start:1863 stop:2810 length:948 start_codon:yes stop_codon:yes gene_type:complete